MRELNSPDRSNLKHVLIVGTNLSVGGLQRAVLNLCSLLGVNGVRVTVLLLYKRPRHYDLSAEIRVIEPATEYRGINRLRYHFALLPYIYSAIRKCKPDLVVSMSGQHNSLAILVAKIAGTKICISDRSSPDLSYSLDVRLLRKIFYPYADGFVAQTKRALTVTKSSLGQKTKQVVIPNLLRKVSTLHGIRQPWIVALGRFYHVKGFDRLVKAFALISEENENWRLVLAGGDGPQHGDVEHLVRELGLTDKVDFLIDVKEPDLLFSQASIFVLPSRSEGFPNALCEAMAAGLPCVAFDISAGPREIITHEHDGLLVADNDIGALAATLNQLIINEPLRARLGQNAKLIQQRLSDKNIGEKWLGFLRNVAA